MVNSCAAIAEEYARLAAIWLNDNLLSCHSGRCENHDVPVKLDPCAYRDFGKIALANISYQFRSCLKTFSKDGTPRRHKV